MAAGSTDYFGKGCIMDLFQILEADFKHEDEKGRLVQLVHKGYSQVNILESKKGSCRGGHFHKVSAEAFFIVSGSADLILKRDGSEQKKRFQAGDFFMIPSGTWHFMDFPEDCIMAALYDVPVEREDGSKDIYWEG